MNTVRIAVGQMNSTLGDFENNTKKIIDYIKEAKNKECDIILFPELAITGYPPEDLVYKKSFLNANLKSLEKILPYTKNIIAIVGFINVQHDIFNSAAILLNGEIKGVYNKIFLPNYGVFDEERYFQRGKNPIFLKINNNVAFGVSICEDIWYPEGPGFASALFNADIILNINASPFYYTKWSIREKMLSIRAIDYGTAIVYCNMVGGQDELVFDGHSLVMNENGEIINRGKPFEEELLITDIQVESIRTKRLKDPRWKKKDILSPIMQPEIIDLDYKIKDKKIEIEKKEKIPPSIEEEVFKGLVLGLKDYFRKNSFSKAVIGISGGIDSALVSAVATVALGKENVTGIFMPSMFTSKESIEDAKQLAKNLGFNLLEISITNIYEAYINSLKLFFKNLPFNTTEENIQARIRGNLLMAFSNKFGWLVITTGNKSEMSTGYATLYGDMAGGFALLKDVPKTLVYEVAKYYNEIYPNNKIPERILKKAPTAELRPNQTDQDTLPPYDILDIIIKAYVEDDKSFEEICQLGIDEEVVKKVITMIDRNEYKRRQAPPGVKITPRAFGKDWRIPITNRFKEF